MPEAPEVWALHKAIERYGLKCEAYGKHLFVNGCDISFGLKGKVRLVDGNIEKSSNHWMLGYNRPCTHLSELIRTNKLGINWMTAIGVEIIQLIDFWKNSRRKLAVLILDQSQIAGIGVAWGSEICYRAGLSLDIPAKEQDLSCLATVLLEMRVHISEIYRNFIENNEPEAVINNWFDNLYQIRKMKVYKKGKQFDIAGRTWWIAN